MSSTWIKLTETLNKLDYDFINMLEKSCSSRDQVSLKLELDYKLGMVDSSITKQQHFYGIKQINEFMCFEGDLLIGYIGINSFGGSSKEIEVNGMVHPEYRRKGIFSTLYNLLFCEYQKRNAVNMLLLSDRLSIDGQAFIKNRGASYKHSEYEMFLNYSTYSEVDYKPFKIDLRKATTADTNEIARQNAIYFRDVFLENAVAEADQENSDFSITLVSPEEEQKRGFTIFIAELEGRIIGKVNLQFVAGLGGIYGLGILPEHRGKGYGRELLMQSIEKLQNMKATKIMLQVEANNESALSLYKSVGFQATSIMDYYVIHK